ncbi:MAG: AmmeMemoRadiSam system protein B [Candidatus Omnitrophota bacterium]
MASFNIRQAAYQGQFYPASARDINEIISGFSGPQEPKIDVFGCMLPHAGYIYSGRVAVETVSRINIKEKVILLGPNHTGCGANFSLAAKGAWDTPLGRLNIDTKLAADLLEASAYLQDDPLAHAREHSLEVELPILQFFRKDFEIVPIAFMSDDLAVLKRVGEDIAGVIERNNLKDKALFVASSDMTHYEPLKSAEAKDKKAIGAILNLDPDDLAGQANRYNISMCGISPVIVMLSAAKCLGAKTAELVRYQTSADVTGDKNEVVGYAGILIK